MDNTTASGESLSLFDLEKEGRVKVSPLGWQERGLSYTASGYGSKVPTSRMIKVDGRWRRVYCICYGNGGTCYVVVKGQRVLVTN